MAVTAAVSLKLPPFWPNDPALWFTQVEAQFATRGVTVEKTKFEYVIASLQPEFATEVRDLILNPPEENPFTTLKTALVDRTAALEQCRLQQLLTEEELGDQKPSQLLHCTVKMKVLYQHLLWCQVCVNVTPGVLLAPQGVTPAL